MPRTTLAALLLVLPSLGVAQETSDRTEAVRDAIAQFDCQGGEIRMSGDAVIAIDGAICAAGRYDIKLDSDLMIRSLTYAGPAATGGPRVEGPGDDVPQEAVTRITAILGTLNCTMETSGIKAIPEGGFRLIGVECPDGQFDIDLDTDLQETGRRPR